MSADLREQLFSRGEDQLRPSDGRIFRLLVESAKNTPTRFLSMREIAEAAREGDRQMDTIQIKNIVQRSVYEIRQRLGREVIVRRGADYRLDLESLETNLLEEDYRKKRAEAAHPEKAIVS